MPADFNPISEPSSSDSKPNSTDNPSPEDSQGGKPKPEAFTLDPEMETDAGMDDAQDGETWTVTMKLKRTDGKWMPMQAMNAKMDQGSGMPDKAMDEEDDTKPIPTVRTPKDMGMENMMS